MLLLMERTAASAATLTGCIICYNLRLIAAQKVDRPTY